MIIVVIRRYTFPYRWIRAIESLGVRIETAAASSAQSIGHIHTVLARIRQLLPMKSSKMCTLRELSRLLSRLQSFCLAQDHCMSKEQQSPSCGKHLQVRQNIPHGQIHFECTHCRFGLLQMVFFQSETRRKEQFNLPMTGPPLVIWFGTVTLMMPWM